jgi:CheY-like chemotaxis protein
MERALIIDDDQLIHYAVSKALHPYFSEIKAVSTEEEGLREISSCFYDVCFLDISVAGLRGVTLLKKIRETSPDTRVVVMSGISMDDKMRSEIEECSCCFLPKPFEISELKAAAGRAESVKHTGEEWYAETRRSARMAIDQTVNYSITVVDQGKPISLALEGDVINVSEFGIGIRTYYPLEPGHLLVFTNGMEDIKTRTGIVRWSTLIDDSYMYRVGIEFIEP